MFSLPKEFGNYQRQDENFFAAMSMRNFAHGKFLVKSVKERMTTCLNILMENIRNKRIVCNFLLRDLSPNDKKALQEVKDLDPKVVDWSNIPDYLPADDFFAMAKMCSGTDTTHSMHSMNWQGFVFGTSLIDYPDKSRVYKSLRKKMLEKYDAVKKERPFMRQDQYLIYYLNGADQMLSAKYRQKYIDYIMKGRDGVVSEPTSEEFNPFERCNSCFFVSFSFKK